MSDQVINLLTYFVTSLIFNNFVMVIKYDIFGEGSQISTNQKRGNSAFSLLIG